jgi:tetratricopeptide (TPR) repeat protein
LLVFILIQLWQYYQLNRLDEEAEKAYYIADYSTALEKCQTGLEIARELGNQRYISMFLNNMGLVYNDLGKYPQALEYYQQALIIDRDFDNKRGEGNLLNNIGNVYLNSLVPTRRRGNYM